jgi:hypothetical protein
VPIRWDGKATELLAAPFGSRSGVSTRVLFPPVLYQSDDLIDGPDLGLGARVRRWRLCGVGGRLDCVQQFGRSARVHSGPLFHGVLRFDRSLSSSCDVCCLQKKDGAGAPVCISPETEKPGQVPFPNSSCLLKVCADSLLVVWVPLSCVMPTAAWMKSASACMWCVRITARYCSAPSARGGEALTCRLRALFAMSGQRCARSARKQHRLAAADPSARRRRCQRQR